MATAFQQAQFLAVRHQRRHAVVAQTPAWKPGGVNWLPRVCILVNGVMGRVAKVVGVGAACERWAGGRLHGQNARLLATQTMADEGHTIPAKLEPPPGATDDHVGPVSAIFICSMASGR